MFAAPAHRPQPDTLQPDAFIPVGVLPDWTQAMHRATAAHHTGQVVLALSHYQAALSMAQGLVEGRAAVGRLAPALSEAEVEARICAFVSSHRCLACLQAEAGSPEAAAGTLAQAHMALLSLVQRCPHTDAWHRAAVWHCRETHAALLAHWAQHGGHADIERALRAGCLPLSTQPQIRPSVH